MFSIEQIIYIKMDLALNNLQRLICHKTQQTKPNQTLFSKLLHCWCCSFDENSRRHYFRCTLRIIYLFLFLVTLIISCLIFFIFHIQDLGACDRFLLLIIVVYNTLTSCDWLIDFNCMPNHLGLFYANRFGNRIHCNMIHIFLWSFLSILYTVLWYQVFQSNTSNSNIIVISDVMLAQQPVL